MFNILNKLNNYFYFNNNLLNIDPLNINSLNNEIYYNEDDELFDNENNEMFEYSIYQIIYTLDIIDYNNIYIIYSYS